MLCKTRTHWKCLECPSEPLRRDFGSSFDSCKGRNTLGFLEGAHKRYSPLEETLCHPRSHLGMKTILSSGSQQPVYRISINKSLFQLDIKNSRVFESLNAISFIIPISLTFAVSSETCFLISAANDFGISCS